MKEIKIESYDPITQKVIMNVNTANIVYYSIIAFEAGSVAKTKFKEVELADYIIKKFLPSVKLATIESKKRFIEAVKQKVAELV